MNDVFVTVKLANHSRYIRGIYGDCARAHNEIENNIHKLNVLTISEQIRLICLNEKVIAKKKKNVKLLKNSTFQRIYYPSITKR